MTFETRRVVLGESIFAAALLVAAGGLAGCSGDKGDKGDPGDPGATGSQGDPGSPGTAAGPAGDAAAAYHTATPIKHVVIVFGENISFDHYFATYPTALPPATSGTDPNVGVHGVPFNKLPNTPNANNLATPLDVNNNFTLLPANLLDTNPNSAKPFRLNPVQASTQDQNHSYGPEQAAANAGAMNLFPEKVGRANPAFMGAPADTSLVMGYYDGNTVTALWNYAQYFALNDNSWTTQFGPSTPGAINLIAGQTNGAINITMPTGNLIADGQGGFTLIGDTDPLNDMCSNPAAAQNQMSGKNIGDLLNTAGITWGAFMGGFDLTVTNANGSFGCSRLTNPTQTPFTGASPDYIPHHAWFQYYASTANPLHQRPSSIAAIGSSVTADNKPEPANHNYDSHDFFDAVKAGNLPAVSFVKAPAYQDGHGGYSNPVDEQAFIVSVVNAVQGSEFWGSTAVILAYDDSDGWYDHQAPPIVNPSSLAAIGSPAGAADTADLLNGAGICNMTTAQQGKPVAATALPGAGTKPVLGRCGYGTRIPLLVVSPYAKKNFIDHTLTDQSSILRFIEDNWLAGARIQAGASFDTIAGPLDAMFSFPAPAVTGSMVTASAVARKLELDPDTGSIMDR